MVEDTRTAARADQLRPLNDRRSPNPLRPLNRPRPVTVQVECGVPVAVIDGAHRRRIERIQDRWHVDDEWWREPIQRRYYRVALDTGSVRTLYQDESDGGWYEQRY